MQLTSWSCIPKQTQITFDCLLCWDHPSLAIRADNMNRILNSQIRTIFVSPTEPKTEPVPNKAFLLEWLFCPLIFQLEICYPSEKSKPLVTACRASGNCKGWWHVSISRQVQGTEASPPLILEPEDSPFLLRSLFWRSSRKQRNPEDPSSNPGCLLAVWPWVSCLTCLGLIVLIYKIGAGGRGNWWT